MSIPSLDEKANPICYNESSKENEKLPKEILNIIFILANELNPSGNMMSISRHWYAEHLEITKKEIHDSLDRFLESLISSKVFDFTQIKVQMQVKELDAIQHVTDFMQLQVALLSSREFLLNILKELDNNDLKKIKTFCQNETKPRFFESLFDLAETYRDIDSLLEEEGKNILAFSWIIQSLEGKWTSHKLNKLLDTTQHVANELKVFAFENIALQLTTKPLQNKAITIALTLEDSIERKNALKLLESVPCELKAG